MNSSQSTRLILNAGDNIHAIEFAVNQIEKSAISEYKKRLAESESFIETFQRLGIAPFKKALYPNLKQSLKIENQGKAA